VIVDKPWPVVDRLIFKLALVLLIFLAIGLTVSLVR
jgi:hypothetical protein